MSGSCLVDVPGVDCIHRNPSMLQLIGMSNPAAMIPFQVFHMPDGHFETLEGWLKRTMSLNPVEAMFGIYGMVCNYSREAVLLIDLLEQQRSVMVGESLSCSYG